ncbi:hypothetical protein B0H21DRAFT_265446 [Amylocystis lapponica]|nr:hypothetical protein B0H21DRAFT_265446 [Amylocystis lapponica]
MDQHAHLLSDSSSDSDTIEMTNLDEIVVTPNPRLQPAHKHVAFVPEEDTQLDDDTDDDEDGDRALLGSRGRDRSPDRHASNWTQVKSIVIETSPTLIITTVGLLLTGEILNNVSHWTAMTRIDELIMIIPVVLNLKGNLEMNLSARLGTAANIGELDKPAARRAIILGNLTLLQVQATVVSFVAACVAFLLGRIIPRPPGEETLPAIVSRAITLGQNLTANSHPRRPRPIFPPGDRNSGPAEFIMVASAAMTSTCISSMILGIFMCTLIVLCRKFGLDPDNIAPPMAACLGDLVTLAILAVSSVLHIVIIDTIYPLLIVILLTIFAVGWTIVTLRNRHVKHMLLEGWTPLFVAMIISSGTGLVLDTFVIRYEGFALLSVVATGLAGSVGSIFVSRLSTALHAAATAAESTGLLQLSTEKDKPHPSSRLVMSTLLLVAFPMEVAFLIAVYAFGWLRLSFIFMFFQAVFFSVTVVISLYIARIATNILWRRDLDPDMYAMPFHSALVDLVGQLLLVACYEIASLLGSHVRSKGS